MHTTGADEMAVVEKEEEEEEEEVPSRVVTSDVVVNVRAQVARFDFEGLSDGHSMRTILAHIAPRHLVIAHGSPQVRPPQYRMLHVHCWALLCWPTSQR